MFRPSHSIQAAIRHFVLLKINVERENRAFLHKNVKLVENFSKVYVKLRKSELVCILEDESWKQLTEGLQETFFSIYDISKKKAKPFEALWLEARPRPALVGKAGPRARLKLPQSAPKQLKSDVYVKS